MPWRHIVASDETSPQQAPLIAKEASNRAQRPQNFFSPLALDGHVSFIFFLTVHHPGSSLFRSFLFANLLEC